MNRFDSFHRGGTKNAFLAALAPAPEERRSSLQPPRMPTLTHATIAAVESNHGRRRSEGGADGGRAHVGLQEFSPEEVFVGRGGGGSARRDQGQGEGRRVDRGVAAARRRRMQARAEKLTRVPPEEVRRAACRPERVDRRADELLNKLNETEQAEASTAAGNAPGAVQFAMSQPQR